VPWQILVTPNARRELRDIPARDRAAIAEALDRLVDSPGSVGVRKLTGRSNEWRLRVGRWRVIFEFDNPQGTIRVLNVLPRDKAYRD
jgi:mRNA interferase RelE/StbE